MHEFKKHVLPRFSNPTRPLSLYFVKSIIVYVIYLSIIIYKQFFILLYKMNNYNGHIDDAIDQELTRLLEEILYQNIPIV